jgi:4-hydroxybenzoate polyprenyltransferase
MTCFLPFMLGQSAISDWQTMLWTIIVLAAITSLLGGWLWYTLILATLAAVVGVAQPPQGASLFFGLMMALVMGIAESFKVSSRVITGIEFVPIDKSTGHAKGFKMPPDALYRCGTNIAATVLPPFFSLTYLITGTSTFWLIATTVSSSTGLLLWLGICPHGNHRIWRAIAFVMGILVPTLVIVGSIGGAEPYVIGDRMRDWIEKVSLSFNGLFVLLLMRGRTVLRELFRPWPPQIFLTRRACAIILLTISNTLLLVVSILERIAGDSGLGSELQNRALWLLIVYMAISMTCAAFIITRSPEQTEAAQSPPAGEGREPSARPTGSMRGQLVGALVSGRPSTSIIALVLTGTIIAKSSSTHLFFAFLRATPIFLVTWAGFILNDAYDWEKDRSSGKRRPIAEGLISRSSAVFLGCFALLMAISIELAVGAQVSLFVLAGVSCAVVGYSPFAFRVPLLKAFYTAALTCAPVYYGCSIAGTRCPSVGYLVLGGFMVGREILADVRDIDEDLAVGLKTVAHRLGRARSLRVGWSAMWIGAMCMLVLVGTPTGLALALGMILSLAASLLTSLRRGITEFTYSRLAMLLGALALSGLVR